MLKRIIAIFSISLIITGSFFSVYNYKCPVFADDSLPSGYTPVTDDIDLAYAFNAYCKSRDLDITSTVPGASITYIYNYIKEYCSAFGYNIDSMQEQLFKSVNDSSTPAVVKWYMKTGLIGMYNDIFAKLIRENDLEVGDTVNDETMYDGYYGGGSFLYYGYNDPFAHEGSYYIYNQDDLYNFGVSNISGYNVRYDLSLPNVDGTYNLRGTVYNGVIQQLYCVENRYLVYSNSNSSIYGYPALYYNTYNNLYYCISVSYPSKTYTTIGLYSANDVQPCNIYITTNNKTINNNTYEGDTIINNNGDINNYPDNPDTPDIPDPNPGPTPDPPTIPDSDGWQDFSLPEMPNDWLIYGMEKKFPFDIPFNILFALSLLNHEPEIPKFEGDIDLQVCTWHYDIDLTPFDDIATILRKFEVLGFIIGLAILTKNLINWG